MIALITALAGWAVIKAPAPIVEQMIQADIRKQAQLWLRRVMARLENPEDTFRTQSLSAKDINYLSLLPEASDVYRFKLFSTDGTVFWSTREKDIGTTTTKPYFAELIESGRTLYMRAQKPSIEIDGLDLHSMAQANRTHETAEIYEVVVADGEVIGVIEFYTDITDIRALFIDRVRFLIAALSALAVATMMIVAAVVYRTNRVQYIALRDRSRAEKTLLNEQLRLTRDVRLLGELNEWLQSSRSLEELFDMVSRFMTHLLPEAEGSVYVYSNSRDVLDGCASWNGGTHRDHIHPEGCWGLRRGRTYVYGASEISFVCEHSEPHDDRPYYCFPILAHGETVGLLHLRAKDHDKDAFNANRDLAQMCAEQISMAIANVRMRDQLHDRSVRDPLTGLFNRRHMTETLRKLIAGSQRTGESFAVMGLDVDHFKKFNDTHGHDAGDMVLRAVGTVLQQKCDRDDVACRPGGEEFTLILPKCDKDDLRKRAEAVRKAVEQINVRYGEKSLPRITVSIGTALYPDHGTMPQDLLRAADDALYEAKSHGRNQVVEADIAHIVDIPPLDPNNAEDKDWPKPENLNAQDAADLKTKRQSTIKLAKK